MSNITYVKGNILSPTISKKRIIIHSCNCLGTWGGGVAYQLGQKYPKTELEYTKICDYFSNDDPRKLLGNFVILPSFKDSKTLIGCLFTSLGGGGSHDSASSILENTQLSLQKLLKYIQQGKKYCAPPNSPSKQVSINTDVFETKAEEEEIGLKLLLELMNEQYFSQFNEIQDLKHFELEMPKINSGIFGVPWENTEKILEALPCDITVYDL
ncbi:hypothetical protein ACO0RG_000311 [Hanseniaspora osmophila]|uniref:ADP-ribose 1''-phosphate phosphatase n=1 Tax=Hanseniaspora osmophila TaxID=56408 RepID=A0A1E5R552_9ASCO|nr:ADP-ribose 1''-phosphate phosphatase [Hanseniaspora osmophila]